MGGAVLENALVCLEERVRRCVLESRAGAEGQSVSGRQSGLLLRQMSSPGVSRLLLFLVLGFLASQLTAGSTEQEINYAAVVSPLEILLPQTTGYPTTNDGDKLSQTTTRQEENNTTEYFPGTTNIRTDTTEAESSTDNATPSNVSSHVHITIQNNNLTNPSQEPEKNPEIPLRSSGSDQTTSQEIEETPLSNIVEDEEFQTSKPIRATIPLQISKIGMEGLPGSVGAEKTTTGKYQVTSAKGDNLLDDSSTENLGLKQESIPSSTHPENSEFLTTTKKQDLSKNTTPLQQLQESGAKKPPVDPKQPPTQTTSSNKQENRTPSTHQMQVSTVSGHKKPTLSESQTVPPSESKATGSSITTTHNTVHLTESRTEVIGTRKPSELQGNSATPSSTGGFLVGNVKRQPSRTTLDDGPLFMVDSRTEGLLIKNPSLTQTSSTTPFSTKKFQAANTKRHPSKTTVDNGPLFMVDSRTEGLLTRNPTGSTTPFSTVGFQVTNSKRQSSKTTIGNQPLYMAESRTEGLGLKESAVPQASSATVSPGVEYPATSSERQSSKASVLQSSVAPQTDEPAAPGESNLSPQSETVESEEEDVVGSPVNDDSRSDSPYEQSIKTEESALTLPPLQVTPQPQLQAASLTAPQQKVPPNKESTNTRKGGIKIKKKKKKKKHGKDNGMSSLIYIPLMIQAQLIPMMLLKLKFLALKALALGKLALLIIGLNILRNAIIGHDSDAEQYEHDSLASQHYGYNGGPEYGSWVNRRRLQIAELMSSEPSSVPGRSDIGRRRRVRGGRNSEGRTADLQEQTANHPYRGYTGILGGF